MKLDDEEKEIYCHECNAYLWSTSSYEPGPDLIKCPYQKDPSGQCTGKPKTQRASQAGQTKFDALCILLFFALLAAVFFLAMSVSV